MVLELPLEDMSRTQRAGRMLVGKKGLKSSCFKKKKDSHWAEKASKTGGEGIFGAGVNTPARRPEDRVQAPPCSASNPSFLLTHVLGDLAVKGSWADGRSLFFLSLFTFQVNNTSKSKQQLHLIRALFSKLK